MLGRNAIDSQCTLQPGPHSPAGDIRDVSGVTLGDVKCMGCKPGTGKLDDHVCLCGSTHNNGCVVIGINAMAAGYYYPPFLTYSMVSQCYCGCTF